MMYELKYKVIHTMYSPMWVSYDEFLYMALTWSGTYVRMDYLSIVHDRISQCSR